MGTRPVMPVDPAGNHTNRVGPHGQGGNVGPAGHSAPIVEPTPELNLQAHTYPFSDVLNWPGVVEEMQRPSTSALLMASARWITATNVVGDADGLPTPYEERYNPYIPIPNMAMFTNPYVRQPNLSSGVPAGVKMSLLGNRFSAFLRTVQGHLLGSP